MIVKYELRQGKCMDCKVAFRWSAKLMRLRDAYCPKCASKLISTNHLLQWPWIDRNPINVREAHKLLSYSYKGSS